ncbi:rhomboid family intramembrane serine protease [Endozoicomonas atrinae]|uniref:rhomboid family intramembrane serine protease n=1 Tax=Endozoicomonas atrinae TaxID=1333660 RepID=UPI003B00A987
MVSGDFVGPNFGGLSGVVYAVLGYVWVYGKVRPSYPFQLSPAIMYMMVAWMLIGFSGLLDEVVGPMANPAHLAGLVCGILLGVTFGIRDVTRKNNS